MNRYFITRFGFSISSAVLALTLLPERCIVIGIWKQL